MEEELICKQCQNVFENPKLFDCCGFTICSQCLTKLFENEVAIQCPNCTNTVNREQSEKFCENVFIINLIEKYNYSLLQENTKRESQFNMTQDSLQNSPELLRRNSNTQNFRQSKCTNQMIMTGSSLDFNDRQQINYDMNNQNINSSVFQISKDSNECQFNVRNKIREQSCQYQCQNQSNEVKYCQRCAEKKGNICCVDCGNIIMCQNCSDIIHSLGIFVSHRLKKISQPELYSQNINLGETSCTIHRELKAVNICTDDWNFLCHQCLQDHEGHNQLQSEKGLEILAKELKSKHNNIKNQCFIISQMQERIQIYKSQSLEDLDRQQKLISAIFSNLRSFINIYEKNQIESFQQKQNNYQDYLTDFDISFKEKLDKCHNAIEFIKQAQDNLSYTLTKGHQFLNDKLSKAIIQEQEILNTEINQIQFAVNSQQIVTEIQSIIEKSIQSDQNLRESIERQQIETSLSQASSQESINTENQNIPERDQEKVLRLSSDEVNFSRPQQIQDKLISLRVNYQTNQGLSSCGTSKLPPSSINALKHRKGNSHTSFVELFSMKQHSQVLKEKNRQKQGPKLEKNLLQEQNLYEDRVMSKEDQELRFTFGKKKEVNVLMQSSIQNMPLKINPMQESSIKRACESNQDGTKRKMSFNSAQQYAKPSKEIKDQVDTLLINKQNFKRHQKGTPSNLENQLNKVLQGNINKTPIQIHQQPIIEGQEKDSPNCQRKSYHENKQKTPIQTPGNLDFQRKVITPKNQSAFQKKDFSLVASKSSLKLNKPLYSQCLNIHDTSLSRMPSMREDSIDLQADSNLSLRRNSRNNLSQIPLFKQSTQQKLSNLINSSTTNCLQSSSSNQNLRILVAKPSELSKKEIKDMIAQPLKQRRFLVKACYSSSVQVSWSHPKGASIEGLRYILEYGVGIRVNNIEQFRQIYKGKAFKCIVTDLMPKTNYRFRVSAVITKEGKDEIGEWSEVESVSTTDIQQIDASSLLNVAVIATPIQKCQSQNLLGVQQSVQMTTMANSTNTSISTSQSGSQNDKWIQFERPGLIHSLNPITFGKHYWSVQLMYTQNLNLNNEEFSGLMKLGVFSKNSTSQKIHGPVVNYSTSKGLIKLKFFLDFEHKQLKVYTQSNPKGEIYTDIPDMMIFSAAQNMTMRSKNATLRVAFQFDLQPFEISTETGCIKDV